MTATRAVQAYLAAVREGLADLPPAERTELLQDVEAHLADVAAEFEAEGEPVTGAVLNSRLGRPEDYAADLRESAGYAGGDKLLGRMRRRNDRRRDLRPRLALWLFVLSCVLAAFVGYLAVDVLGGDSSLLVALVAVAVPALIAAALVRSVGIAALTGLPEVRRVQDRVESLLPRTMPSWWSSVRPHLGPTWYVVRGWAAAVAFGVALDIESAMLPFPRLSFAGLVGAALIGGGIVGSFWLGQRAKQDRNWLWFVLPANAAAVAALLFVPSVNGYNEAAPVSTETVYVEKDYPANALVDSDGQRIKNLYVFDENGEPLTNVFVYDHKGRAVVLPRKVCRGDDSDAWAGRSRPGDNRFPHPRVDTGWEKGHGTCELEAGVPFTVAVPIDPERRQSSEPDPTPTPTPTPTEEPDSTPTPDPTPTPTRK